ncbi:MAG: Rossmann fold nucleotide-binding [Planctomycetota bacterium]|nr:MAG: Rossmann fold nucleotide-binding [Planctomycetota bacterium]
MPPDSQPGIPGFRRDFGAFDRAADELLTKLAITSNADLVRELIVTALRLADDSAERGDVKIVSSALKELRYAFKTFAPWKEVRKVSVFGSARTPTDHLGYKQALEFGKEMAKRGFMIITGAGPGIMRAGNEGAGAEKSFGVNIRLPFEQRANTVIYGDKKLVTFRYFFTRKLMFIKEADGVAFFPGGFGTMDEMYETLTLVQTGKTVPIPLVMVDAPGGTYWADWHGFVERLIYRGLVSEEDNRLFKVAYSVNEACDEICNFYRVYNSSRYVKGRFIIRLNGPLSAGTVARLKAEFADIHGGDLEMTGVHPEEAREERVAHLPRLAMNFNRRNQGRLRQMIDLINLEPGSAAPAAHRTTGAADDDVGGATGE